MRTITLRKAFHDWGVGAEIEVYGPGEEPGEGPTCDEIRAAWFREKGYLQSAAKVRKASLQTRKRGD